MRSRRSTPAHVAIVVVALAAATAGDLQVAVGGPAKPKPSVALKLSNPDGKCPADMAFIQGSPGSMNLGAAIKAPTADYCIDGTEVTVEAYASCVAKGNCSEPDHVDCESNAENAARATHPVNCVTWPQADTYCDWLGKRLPTEEEWWWAASNGSLSAYPWGDSAPGKRACWNGKGNDVGLGKRRSTCPVASHTADVTQQGLVDMAGNVAEWTSTLYGNTQGGAVTRGVLGGAWFNQDPRDLEANSIEAYDLRVGLYFVGFRCAKTP